MRLGTRRRKPRQAVSVVPEAGASRFGKAEAPSLDTEKVLTETSVREWSHAQKSDYDMYREQLALQRQLLSTVHTIWQDYAAAAKELAEMGCDPAPHLANAAKWEKQWFQIHNCQAEWIGYRADCCKEATQPTAVPIGCKHRLCPLCAWDRSRLARKRIKTMFDRLTHPVLITLTIPNRKTIRKHDYTVFRQHVRKFIAQQGGWILGGVYSLETTYNRMEKTWHIHAHILADVTASLPTKKDKYELAGERVYAFTAMKLKLEFDWLRLWGSAWGKKAKKNAEPMDRAGERFDFDGWVKIGRRMKVKEWRAGKMQPIEGITPEDAAMRTQWNRENRRIVDIRPVLDRDGAAREVLKYITKVADFCDLPEAVEPFCDAVKGARLIQTFGSWYGIKLDETPDPENPETFGEMECTCGCNTWRRMGVFYRADVEMHKDGRWRLKSPLNHNCAGTIPRPRIRALDAREE